MLCYVLLCKQGSCIQVKDLGERECEEDAMASFDCQSKETI